MSEKTTVICPGGLRLGTDSAEEESRSDLESYFYGGSVYQNVLTGKVRILIGSRGVGKSAILRIVASKHAEKGEIVIELPPQEYSFELFSSIQRKDMSPVAWRDLPDYSVSWQYLIFILLFKQIASRSYEKPLGTAHSKILEFVSGLDHAKHSSIEGLYSYKSRIELARADLWDSSKRRLQALHGLEEIHGLFPALKEIADLHRMSVFADELVEGFNSTDALLFMAGLLQAAQKVHQFHHNINIYFSWPRNLGSGLRIIPRDAKISKHCCNHSLV